MTNQRLKKLFESFSKNKIDALFVSSWPNVTYLSGFKGTESWILVSLKGLYFITDSRYSEQAAAEAMLARAEAELAAQRAQPRPAPQP